MVVPDGEKVEDPEKLDPENPVVVENPPGEPSGDKEPGGEGEPAPSLADVLKKVDDLNQSISERDKRIEALEGKAKEERPVSEGPKPLAQPNIKAFVESYTPKAKEIFSSEETSEKDKFDVMFDVADKMLGSVLTDKVLPAFQAVADRLSDLSNRLEASEISISDPDFVQIRDEIFGILKKLPASEREKPDAVSSIYAQLKGKVSKKEPAKVPSREVLRDVGGGTNGASSGKGVVVLSADQEEDRKQISGEAGHEMSPSDYKMKYEAKVKYYKSQGKKVPATLRDF